MAAISKKIEKGNPLGRRDTLRIAGTGCICSVPGYREVKKGGNDYSFLHARIVSNSIRKNDDGSADQFSEFTDIILSGNRAKALAKVLAVGQIVEFAGRLRTRSFDSDRYFDKDGKPAQIYRTECNIGQDGWINIMKDSAEGKGEKAALPSDTTTADQAKVAPTGELMQQIQTLLTAMQTQKAAQPAQAPDAPAAEQTVDVSDDDIPF